MKARKDMDITGTRSERFFGEPKMTVEKTFVAPLFSTLISLEV